MVIQSSNESLRQSTIATLKQQHAGICSKYVDYLSEDYLSEYTVEAIVKDLLICESLSTDFQYSIQISPNKDIRNIWQIKLLKLGDIVSLSRGLPIIENFGVKLLYERPYQIKSDKSDVVYICDFGVKVSPELFHKIEDKQLLANLEAAIIAVFNRQADNDALNKLVLFSGLTIREVVLIRAITHYITQTALPFSKAYLVDTLCLYPKVAGKLYQLFDTKFNLKSSIKVEQTINQIHEDIIQELNKVTSLDHDRILHAYLDIILAMVRTNYHQVDDHGKPKCYISFKLQSARLSFLPKPLPLYEIFVYSMRFEAIHLRGGKVARGGLRWSDRREDFRTEVLALAKAQIVKNSVIVPTGSKGGFVCKKLPSINDREEYIQEGIKCYKDFISGLLDITDNLVAGKVIPPKDVIRYDEDDPYLVVAADKGTATFSDYANQISLEYGFWLGDAFASGGSVGYDHKKMGITARGAWESAKRHFRHLALDIQTQDFTVIGIGDMAGDVFGNGMLLSEHIRLLAAFNHQHIFLDPNPDALTSYLERKRLFNLGRSTWADYDIGKISKGGGVFSRSLKSILLSDEVKKWLGVSLSELSPNELINLILQARADLLYNGGVGTYVKAETESHDVVKDKANDALRVNGKDLKVKVVVEGGNLGVTQLGRVEYAKNGGAICTDAIDNSAGVDCSDHEVNIKILFADVMQKSDMTVASRNEILDKMTDDVANLVLQDNYLQTDLLRYADARSAELFSIHSNYIDKLEKQGELDRNIEYLPNHVEAVERLRLGKGLTQPELAVLLAYTKNILNRQILTSPLVKDPIFTELLVAYFPTYIQKHYLNYIYEHYLREEIIANQLANLVVNRIGFTFISRFEDEFCLDSVSIIRAFWAVYKVIDAEDVLHQIESLDNKVSADIQVQMRINYKKALERMTRWVLRRTKNPYNVFEDIICYQEDISRVLKHLPQIIRAEDHQTVADVENDLIKANVPSELINVIARTNYIPQLLDIAMLAREFKHDLVSVAENYFFVGHALRIDYLHKNLIALPESNKWQALARSALLADGYQLYSSLIRNALSQTSANDNKFTRTWMQREPAKIAKVNAMLDELQSYKNLDLAMLSAAMRELGSILV